VSDNAPCTGDGRIIAALAPLAVPIDRLRTLAGNPHHGDVEALMRSWERFGQRRPLVARRDPDADTGEVIDGNHGLEAARRLGWSAVAVAWVDDDQPTALAWAAAANRTAQLGHDDPEALTALLMTVRATDADLFAATAWTEGDLVKMLDGGTTKPGRPARAGGTGDQAIESSWAIVITCTDEAEQLELLDRLAGEGLSCRALIS
jgi:ParB family chromosome partitioning protein